MRRYLFAAAALLALMPSTSQAAPPPAETLQMSEDILKNLATDPLKAIPPDLLKDAQGVAIIPHVVKAGFVIAGSGGHGIVMSKDKEGRWSEPVFIDFGGASVGFQAGVESTDVVLVFRTRKSLDRILEGKGKFTLGADASIAAGPVGRKAAAGTDAKLEAEILSYSRSRGLFAGVSLDGAVLNPDAKVNAAFNRVQSADERKLVDGLKFKLTELSEPRGEIRIAPPVIPGPPPTVRP